MSLPEHIRNRKGPRSSKDLNPEVLEYLNAGKTETKNLIEWLAVDQLTLLKTVLEKLGHQIWFEEFEMNVNAQKKPTANSTTKVIGHTFHTLTNDVHMYSELRAHPSDVVRCWACWAESKQHDYIYGLLEAMKVYAADTHFGVREVVIFASKEKLIENLNKAIYVLSTWTFSENENIRRYSVEALRPVGVWTKKIPALQSNPELGLPIIEQLKADPSKYVRDSVGNWINDAAKSNPDWARELAEKWTLESEDKHTSYILKRGLRSLK